VNQREMKHFAVMVLIGDGVMGLLRPSRDAAAWKHGPLLWRKSMALLQRSPTATRMVAVAQIAGGVWWALHREKDARAQLAA
jgi:hypothetical protein